MPVLHPDQIDPPPRAPLALRAAACFVVYAAIFGSVWALGVHQSTGMTFAVLNAACLLVGGLTSGAVIAHLDRRCAERMISNGGRHG
ncbi:MAG: hypothetical protein AAFN79_18645 [Pseudomonadota bacterium]